METIEKQGKLCQMRLSEETLDRIDRLKVLTGLNNRALLISELIRFSEDMIKEIRNGNELMIHYKNGKIDKIVFPDL